MSARNDSNGGAGFWSRVSRSDSCWMWLGPKNGDGYGALRFGGRKTKAHRASWLLTQGPIPDGMCVLHRCDNRACVRPDHLFLGTHVENMADMVAKGRGRNNPALGEQCSTAVLTESKVIELRALREHGVTYSSLAQRFGVSEGAVKAACARRSWAHVGKGA